VSFLIVMVLLLVVMYVLMIRPQRQRQQQHQSMIESAGVGEDVLTTGGIYGTVVEAEGDDLVVEIAEGVTVHMTRKGIAAVLPPEEDELEEEEDAETLRRDALDEAAAEVDEAAVRTREEAITSTGDADAASRERG
jgi:preprotein translocase subunit YajC